MQTHVLVSIHTAKVARVCLHQVHWMPALACFPAVCGIYTLNVVGLVQGVPWLPGCPMLSRQQLLLLLL